MKNEAPILDKILTNDDTELSNFMCSFFYNIIEFKLMINDTEQMCPVDTDI